MHHHPRALHPFVCWQHSMEGGHEGVAPVKSKKPQRAPERAAAESCSGPTATKQTVPAWPVPRKHTVHQALPSSQGQAHTCALPGDRFCCTKCPERDSEHSQSLVLHTHNIKGKKEQGLHEKHAPLCVSSPSPAQPVAGAVASTEHSLLHPRPCCSCAVKPFLLQLMS